jgi:hypothetical protein
LFGGIDLPEWSAARVYELFLLLNNAVPKPQQEELGPYVTPAHRDEYARQVMILVTANFRRHKWLKSLHRIEMDAEAAAADIVAHLVRKTPAIKLEFPCEKVVVDYLTRMIFNRMTSLIRQHLSKQKMRRTRDNGIDPDSVLDRVLSPSSRPVDLAAIGRQLRAKEEDVVGKIPGDVNDACVLYRYLYRSQIKHAVMPSHQELPARLRDRVAPDGAYFLAVVGVRKALDEIAADAA